jgi:hypothetical protein
MMRTLQMEMSEAVPAKDFAPDKHFAIDTTFVLFFLAVDTGQTILRPDLGTFLAGVTLLMLVTLPYFLYERSIKPAFAPWAATRAAIACFAVLLGIAYGSAAGNILPAGFESVPFTLLIVAAMISCYMQFYDIIKVRIGR